MEYKTIFLLWNLGPSPCKRKKWAVVMGKKNMTFRVSGTWLEP